MTTTDDTRPEESNPVEERYAGVPSPDGYLVYDVEQESAWIGTDTGLSLEEVR